MALVVRIHILSRDGELCRDDPLLAAGEKEPHRDRADTSIDEGKQTQTLPQEPDPGADRFTYAELDGQELQAKLGGRDPAPEPAQPSVYAVINSQSHHPLLPRCRFLLWGPSTMGPSPALLLALGIIWTRLPFAAASSPYSKPSISLSPSGEIAPGTDVTISCHGPQQGVRFKMYRAGVARWHTEPAGSIAEFRIPNARREDGGIYTCSYESLTEPPVSSPHSDPVQLVVEAHYSKPSISLSPSGEIAPGTDVTISCRGPRQGVRFKMYRASVARWHTEPPGLTAEFRIPNARREDGGIYTCSYESLREPPVSSPHSDPVQLVIAGPPPKQDYPPFAIVRLSLAAGVLLALVLVLAEAAYSWRRTPHSLTPPRPGGERGRQPEGQTETPAWELQPPQIPARSLGIGTAGHTHQGERGAVIGPMGPSTSVSPPHSPPQPPQIRSMGPSTSMKCMGPVPI
ncbi:immunoglobulin superfamily member 1-like [Malaclemys terrapin pileata]|uniref:immunoglobulin superfamily member 1-like n=1 Tax=Malaclemys terrapin pileata TaxID=2991368 RepID=UPI0023A7E222|nr:immunoglobulin superfamily member 1-like [Malaclemys terrapin pileata]